MGALMSASGRSQPSRPARPERVAGSLCRGTGVRPASPTLQMLDSDRCRRPQAALNAAAPKPSAWHCMSLRPMPAKYGALSVAVGRVDVRWRLEATP